MSVAGESSSSGAYVSEIMIAYKDSRGVYVALNDHVHEVIGALVRA